MSPGRIGQRIGWQIVRSFMNNNDVNLQQLLQMDPIEIFQKSKYKISNIKRGINIQIKYYTISKISKIIQLRYNYQIEILNLNLDFINIIIMKQKQ